METVLSAHSRNKNLDGINFDTPNNYNITVLVQQQQKRNISQFL